MAEPHSGSQDVVDATMATDRTWGTAEKNSLRKLFENLSEFEKHVLPSPHTVSARDQGTGRHGIVSVAPVDLSTDEPFEERFTLGIESKIDPDYIVEFPGILCQASRFRGCGDYYFSCLVTTFPAGDYRMEVSNNGYETVELDIRVPHCAKGM